MHDLRAPTHGATFELLVAHFENASHSSRVVPLEAPWRRRGLARARRTGCADLRHRTDARACRSKHLARVGLLDGLRAQLFSDEVGVPKPDARIFRAALAALGVAARRRRSRRRPAPHRRRRRAQRRDAERATARDSRRCHRAAEADHVAASHAELRAIFGVL